MASLAGGFPQDAALTVTDLACRRGERLLFEGIDLGLKAGDLLFVIGPNGAGKTSLLRILAGLLRPAAGRIAFDPSDGARDERDDLAALAHFVGSRDAVKPAMTCREHVLFWNEVLGGDTLDPAAALAEWGMAEQADVPASYLSSGQRKRLALSRLSSAARPLWLLDEPGNALDKAALANLAMRLDAFTGRGGIAVIATHVILPVARARTLELSRA